LHEVQVQLRACLLIGDADGVPPWVMTRPGEAGERLDVYRTTVLETLGRALRLSFPTVCRLVGVEFFAAAAQVFAPAQLPTSADLNAYGQDFAAFLQRFEPCAALAYLPDVARLDWAVSRALHAPDSVAVTSADLLGLSDEQSEQLRFSAHPSITFIRSQFPVDVIWRAVTGEDDGAIAAIDLTSGPVHLIVERPVDQLEVSRLSAAEWSFSEALLSGHPLGEAIVSHPMIDIPAMLAQLLTRGRVVGVHVGPLQGGAP
jgi:hypothetical protein